jgi:hypothetical protein
MPRQSVAQILAPLASTFLAQYQTSTFRAKS